MSPNNLPKIRLQQYGGEEDKGSYEAWRGSVAILRKVHSDRSLLRHVVLALRGFPLKVALDVADTRNGDLEAVLKELDAHFRNPKDYIRMEAKLQAMVQQPNEKVSPFGVRIGNQVDMMQKHYPDFISNALAKELRKGVFLKGLLPHIKSAVSYLRDRSRKATYQEVLAAARLYEDDPAPSGYVKGTDPPRRGYVPTGPQGIPKS